MNKVVLILVLLFGTSVFAESTQYGWCVVKKGSEKIEYPTCMLEDSMTGDCLRPAVAHYNKTYYYARSSKHGLHIEIPGSRFVYDKRATSKNCNYFICDKASAKNHAWLYVYELRRKGLCKEAKML